MKKILQKIFNFFGYSLIREKNFQKLYRTLDKSIQFLIDKDNPLIIDVGAHTGESIKRFRKIYNNCEIHSFEPQPKSFKKLNYLKNSKTIINNFALGEKQDTKNFYIHNNDSTSSFYKFSNLNIKENNELIEKTKIETLDEYVKKKNLGIIDILKIDVQGYEDQVLKGAVESIKHNVKIIELEIIFIDYYEKKSCFNDIENILKPLDFELYTVSSPVLNDTTDRLKWLDAIYVSKKYFK
jgi:FkbM family methyltransferase